MTRHSITLIRPPAPSTFEPDSGAANQRDWAAGQGHRHGLASHLGGPEDHWETVDVRVGEERRLFLQQRGDNAHGSHLSGPASRPASAQRPFLHGRPAVGPVSAGSTSSNRQTPMLRGDHARNGTRTRQRAASPRSHGTIRFLPDGQRSVAVNGKTVTSAASQAVTGTASESSRSKTANGRAAVSPRLVVPGAASLQAGARPLLPTTPDRVRTGTAPSVKHPAQQSTPTNPARSTPAQAATDFFQVQICQSRALGFVASPGPACNEYYQTHPEELEYFRAARDRLIKEVIELARAGSDEDRARYLQTHRERRWMVDAAEAAKLAVEAGTDAAAEQFLAANSRHKLFLEAAQAVLEPLRTSTPSLSGTHAESSEMAGATEASEGPTRVPASTGPFLDAAEPSTERRDSSVGINYDHAVSQQVASSGSSVSPAAETSGESSPQRSSEASLSTAASSTQAAGPGSLTAIFFNLLGEYMGLHQAETVAPVHMTISVYSNAAGYDPRELIHGIQALATNLQDRSSGNTEERRNVGAYVGGQARMRDGGLWHEDV